MAVPQFKYDDWLLSTQYHALLLNEVHLVDTIDVAPYNPQPGDLYVFKNKDNNEDWRSDKLRWRHKGVKHIPKDAPVITVQYFHHIQSNQFEKRVISLYEQHKKIKDQYIFLLHYVGSLRNISPLPHGNRKLDTSIPYFQTAKSQLSKQKAALNELPGKVYKKLCVADVPPPEIATSLPRNVKQVENTIRNEQQRKLLSQDDCYGLYLINEELNGYLEYYKLLPDFLAVPISEEMIRLFEEAVCFDQTVVFYDTTFKLGDFYVSPLVFKHGAFKSKPVIPLTYLIHHYKKKTVHTDFLLYVRNACPEVEKAVIVTDREAAIGEAIKTALPKNVHFYCWNHIQQDVRFWVKSQKTTTKDDVEVYASHVWDLLDSDSEEACLNKMEKMMQHWSVPFKDYFEKNLKQPIFKSGKWQLLKYHVYTERSGITINPSEAYNSVLKRFISKEVCLQVLVLTMYQLDQFYTKELLKGLCEISQDYILKNEASGLARKVEEINWPKASIKLENLPYVFENRNLDMSKKTDNEEIYTQFGVAKMLVVNGCVRLIPEEQVFVINGKTNKNLVTLYPKETCTCKQKKKCHHVKAAQISIGLEKPLKKKVKLSSIVKRKKAFRSGRKKPPKLLKEVEAAEDCPLPKDPSLRTSLLVPTLQADKVKDRFSDLDETPVPTSTSTPHSTPVRKDAPFDHREVLRKPALKIRKIPGNDTHEKENLLQYVQNQQDVIFGRPIYPTDLLCLEQDEYFNDTVIDVYLGILVNTAKVKESVNIFSIESFILANSMIKDNGVANTLKYFDRHSVYDKDVILIPVTKNSHITLMVLIKKLKLVINLNSIKSPFTNGFELLFILKSLKESSNSHSLYFPSDWRVYNSSDIPQQRDGFNCGAYCCLFAEILITGNGNILNYHSDDTIGQYRKVIKSKILTFMYSSTGKVDTIKEKQNENIIYRNELSRFSENIRIEMVKNIPVELKKHGKFTTDILQKLICGFWDEDTESYCYLAAEKCNNLGGTMVLCEKCSHWYHQHCVGLIVLPKSYICSDCR